MNRAGTGLAVLHVDGLSHAELLDAVEGGFMPATRRLIEREGFVAEPYRCGIPSTTPFAQAGILYGDNRDIPSFRWFDKQAGTVIEFGARATFPQVAHKYFHGTRPLCEGGASIAACYPAGAAETFGLTYRDRGGAEAPGKRTARETLAAYAVNPRRLGDLAGHGAQAIAATAAADVRTRLAGGRPARSYVISDMLEEVLLHHVTRYAAVRAMEHGYPAIYAALYAYDETGHAFGPQHPYTRAMLRHVDATVAALSAQRLGGVRDYELVVLSDHGQVPTRPFVQLFGTTLGSLVAEWLPGCRVDEQKGGRHGPKDGISRVVLTHSGGLSHLYFADWPHRLPAAEVAHRFRHIIDRLAAHPGVALVLARDGRVNHLYASGGVHHAFERRPSAAVAAILGAYDDPAILTRQLDRLNSFERSGDLVVFGRWDSQQGFQVNFEDQAGGHGSIGGAQVHPFVLAREGTGVPEAAPGIEGAHQLHAPLWRLRPGG